MPVSSWPLPSVLGHCHHFKAYVSNVAVAVLCSGRLQGEKKRGFWTFSPCIWFVLFLSTERKCERTDEAGERAKRSAFLSNVTISNLRKRIRAQHTPAQSRPTQASALSPAFITREHAYTHPTTHVYSLAWENVIHLKAPGSFSGPCLALRNRALRERWLWCAGYLGQNRRRKRRKRGKLLIRRFAVLFRNNMTPCQRVCEETSTHTMCTRISGCKVKSDKLIINPWEMILPSNFFGKSVRKRSPVIRSRLLRRVLITLSCSGTLSIRSRALMTVQIQYHQ